MCVTRINRRRDERNRQREPDIMVERDAREKDDEQPRQEQGEHQFRFQSSDIHLPPNLPYGINERPAIPTGDDHDDRLLAA